MERERVELSQPQDLIALAMSGDRDAFGELVAQHQHEVYTLAVRLMRDRDLAADVSQDAFIRAWRAMNFLWGTCGNLAANLPQPCH